MKRKDSISLMRYGAIMFGVFFLAVASLCHSKEGPEHECTSWMLFPDVAGGKFILHKNRDAILSQLVICSGDGVDKFKWIGLGRTRKSPCMGFSEKGLAIVMNGGEETFENESPAEGRMGTTAILRELLENCSSASEAKNAFTRIIEDRRYTHNKNGSIFFMMDTHEGYIVECTAHHSSSLSMTTGVQIRGNVWHNPGMSIYSRNPCAPTMNSAAREYQAKMAFNQVLGKRDHISLQDIWAVSRLLGDVKAMGDIRGLCSKYTNSASTFELDAEFPDVLCTAFLAIGPPRHTLFLPVPICIVDFPTDIMDGSWSQQALNRFEELGLEFGGMVWNNIENELLSYYSQEQEKARVMLRSGKRDAAIEIVRNAFNEVVLKARKEVFSKYKQ